MANHDDNNKLLIDIAQRLSNIEGRLDVLDKLDFSIEQIRDTANKAHGKAQSAYNYAIENSKDVNKLAGTIKWAIGLTIPTILTIIGLIITLFAT